MPDLDPTDARNAMLAIQMGVWDDQLDALMDAISRRRRAAALEMISTVVPGDRIAISDKVRPQLLAGAICEVVSVDADGKLKVRLETRVRSDKWRVGEIITLGPTLVGRKVQS